MVCPRCIRVVMEDLEKLGLEVTRVILGQAEVEYNPEKISRDQIKNTLEIAGFELLEDQENQLIEHIKLKIRELVNEQKLSGLKVNISSYLETELGHNYGYLSRLFSQQAGITIEKFLIRQKIEKVKEYLKYESFSSEEIAFRLDYSSVAHLSRQFKELTGMTLSTFRKDNKLV